MSDLKKHADLFRKFHYAPTCVSYEGPVYVDDHMHEYYRFKRWARVKSPKQLKKKDKNAYVDEELNRQSFPPKSEFDTFRLKKNFLSRKISGS